MLVPEQQDMVAPALVEAAKSPSRAGQVFANVAADAEGVAEVARAAEDLGYEVLPGSAWLEQQVDILIPAALENFFKEENLASLRELAMRQIADRLEAERRGPSGAAEAETVGDKVMVAMSSNPETTRLLLRRASALASILPSRRRPSTDSIAALRS